MGGQGDPRETWGSLLYPQTVHGPSVLSRLVLTSQVSGECSSPWLFMKDGTAAETMPRRAKSLLQPSHASHLDILIFSSGLSGPVILKLALGVEFSILTFKQASKQANKKTRFAFSFLLLFPVQLFNAIFRILYFNAVA